MNVVFYNQNQAQLGLSNFAKKSHILLCKNRCKKTKHDMQDKPVFSSAGHLLFSVLYGSDV